MARARITPDTPENTATETAVQPPVLPHPSLPSPPEPGAAEGNNPAPPAGRRKTPKPPGTVISGDQFAAYTASLNPDDWAHILGYLYRLWPVLIDDRDPKHVQKISESLSEADVLREHGSGDYAAVLNDTELPGSNRTICRVKKWSIRDPNRPPIIPDLSHVARADPANREFVQSLIRRNLLMPDGSIPALPAPAPAGNDPSLTNALSRTLDRLLNAQLAKETTPPRSTDAEALSRIMDMLQRGHEQSTQMLVSTMQAQNPTNTVELLTALKDLIAPATAPANPIANMREMLAALREISQPPATASNPVAQLKELFAIANEFKDFTGAETAARAPKAHWTDYIPLAVHSLSQIAERLITNRAPAMQANGRAGYPMPAAGAPHQADAAIALAAAPETFPADPAMQAAAASVAADPAVQQLASFLPLIGAPLLNFLNTGRSGGDFADYLSDGYGEIVYRQVCALSSQQIRAAFELDPQLSRIVATMPGAVDQFIADFLHPPPVDEDELALEAAQ